MYLSKYRLKVDFGNRMVLNDVINSHQMHRSIQDLFNTGREANHILYTRHYESPAKAFVYIYSDVEPIKENDHFEQIYSNKMNLNFQDGQECTFYFACSPVKKNNGKKYELYKDEDRFKWLYRNAKNNGFRIIESEIKKESRLNVKKDGQKEFSVQEVVFTGILQITNVELFQKALKNGIGPEKAYGLGMLMVA